MATICIVGAGNIGGRLAKRWAQLGHQIQLATRPDSSRDTQGLVDAYPHNIKALPAAQAAQGADFVVLAAPADRAFEATQALGDLTGKVIIDCMNAVFRKPVGYPTTTAAIQAASGNDRIVKCFNWIGAENIDDPTYPGGLAADMLMCGQYPDDKARVAELVTPLGYGHLFDVGGLDKEPLLEQGALIWGALAYGAGLGRNIAFKVLIKD